MFLQGNDNSNGNVNDNIYVAIAIFVYEKVELKSEKRREVKNKAKNMICQDLTVIIYCIAFFIDNLNRIFSIVLEFFSRSV
jgi:hypothetical protein